MGSKRPLPVSRQRTQELTLMATSQGDDPIGESQRSLLCMLTIARCGCQLKRILGQGRLRPGRTQGNP